MIIVMGTKLAALRREAFLLESQAAMMLIDKKDAEPTRSVLFRSAAWLAHNCGQFKAGLELANEGLRGNPPAEIIEELRQARQACIDNFPKK